MLADPGLALTVVEHRLEGRRQLHPAANAFHHAQDLAERVARSPSPHGEAIDQPSLVVPRPEGGLQDQGALQVTAGGDVAASHRRDGAEPPVVPIQEPAEG